MQSHFHFLAGCFNLNPATCSSCQVCNVIFIINSLKDMNMISNPLWKCFDMLRPQFRLWFPIPSSGFDLSLHDLFFILSSIFDLSSHPQLGRLFCASQPWSSPLPPTCSYNQVIFGFNISVMIVTNFVIIIATIIVIHRNPKCSSYQSSSKMLSCAPPTAKRRRSGRGVEASSSNQVDHHRHLHQHFHLLYLPHE